MKLQTEHDQSYGRKCDKYKCKTINCSMKLVSIGTPQFKVPVITIVSKLNML